MEDYIHRIGRTGRHNASGTSYAFLTDEDANKAKDLINVLRDANQNVVPELEELARSASKSKKSCRFFFYIRILVSRIRSLLNNLLTFYFSLRKL